MNGILCKDKTAQYLAKYFDAAYFSPTLKTLINATKRNCFVFCPGSTADLIRKTSPLSIPTAKGHLNQDKKGLQSTKTLSNHQ